MSSFDKTAGKNLDEILASIRKTLADESSEPQPKPPSPAGGADPSMPAAASQNGSKPAIAKIDDDLADLLAGGVGPAAAQMGPQEAPETAAEAKDPLWFLRPSGGHAPVTPARPDDPSPPAVDGPAGPAVSPERSSLAALFVADRGSEYSDVYAAAAALASSSLQAKGAPIPDPPAKDAKVPDPTAAPDLTPPGKATPEPSPPPQVAAGGKPTADTAPAAVPATSSPQQLKPGPASGPAAGVDVASAPLKPQAPQDQPTPMGPRSPRPAGPESPLPAAATLGPGRVQGGGGMHSASAGPRANALNGATPAAAPLNAAGASAVPAAANQALEQIIEQLLEPLLRRWVEANLPGLVDAAIRAEVARMLEARRTNGPDIDRKM